MARKKVNTFFMKKEVYQFKVACVLYLNIIQNRELKDQIDNCLSQQFDVRMSQQIRRTLKQ